MLRYIPMFAVSLLSASLLTACGLESTLASSLQTLANGLGTKVTTSAAAAQLTIERIDNQGDGSLQVSLQPVAFNLLLRWFNELEAQGVRIDEAGLDRNEEGLVTSRLTLRVAQ